MPDAFLVTFHPSTRVAVGSGTPQKLHALLLHLIAQADPALAEQLHNAPSVKPFTVSPLWGATDGILQPEHDAWVRYTLLATTARDALLESLMNGANAHLDGVPLTITQAVSVAGGPWVGRASYQDLLAHAKDQDLITLEFASPTAIARRGINYPFPDPAALFTGYHHKWQLYAPEPLLPLPPLLADHVLVSHYQLATRRYRFGTFQQVGFVGRCTFRLKGLDTSERRLLNTLADFAFYAGSGVKTTMGFGQTRRLQ